MRLSSDLMIRSVFHSNLLICHVPRRNDITGMDTIPRSISTLEEVHDRDHT